MTEAPRQRPFLVGNWKMHGSERDLEALHAVARAGDDGIEVALCLPATLLDRARAKHPSLRLGGQDCDVPGPALTGGISPAMLQDAGATLVLVGHSERRRSGDTNAVVRAKAEAALAAGMDVILCVGEHEAGYPDVAFEELIGSLPDVPEAASRLLVAYEPVWAIGSGQTPEPSEISALTAGLRSLLENIYEGDVVRILYGGSVAAHNAAAILEEGGVDGLLIGNASRAPSSLLAIFAALT